jgi:2-polyprenyl-3-methyl-5-hydroxy-6-metoxy-1,4-benzoquinol methylase
MLVALLLCCCLLASDSEWQDFSRWFKQHGTPGAPAAVIKDYTVKLQADGLNPEQVQLRIKEVQEYMTGHPQQALALHFDRMYTWSEAPFTREPSNLLIRVASSRKRGKALDIAMGQGRNALWLAKAGWTVSGYDISEEALRQANAAASAAGVKLDTRLASHDEYELGESQWDLILMSFAFTRLSDAAYMKRVRDSLKPGGVLIIEGFNGGPRQGDPNLILKAMLEYRVLLFEDLPDVGDWGRAKAQLLRVALEKQ